MPKPKDLEGKWQGRKAGSYKWFEVQDTTSYFKEFEKPKIAYAEKATRGHFYLDFDNNYFDTTAFILSSANKYLIRLVKFQTLYFNLFKNKLNN